MSDAVLISFGTSIAAVIMAGIAAYFSYKGRAAAKETHEMAAKTHEIAEHTYKQVNSRMTEMLDITKQLYRAIGAEEGKAESDKEHEKEL